MLAGLFSTVATLQAPSVGRLKPNCVAKSRPAELQFQVKRCVGNFILASLVHIGCQGETPLHNAAYGGHVDCVRVLVAAGASLEAIAADGRGLNQKLYLSNLNREIEFCCKCLRHDALR